MAGHSKWANIKHRKGAQDAKKASVFTKYARLITIAAKEGGDNLDTNFKLKLAIDKAKSVNMPKDNIERAIRKGTGEMKNESQIEEVIYEAYGPGLVAMLIKTATDNRNRTIGEVKNIITKAGGKMVPSGSVSFMFRQVGNIEIPVTSENLDEMELKAIEAGAEDTIYAGDTLTVYTKATDLQKVKEGLDSMGVKTGEYGLVYVATQKTQLDENSKIDYERLLEELDDQEDVQEVYDNLE